MCFIMSGELWDKGSPVLFSVALGKQQGMLMICLNVNWGTKQSHAWEIGCLSQKLSFLLVFFLPSGFKLRSSIPASKTTGAQDETTGWDYRMRKAVLLLPSWGDQCSRPVFLHKLIPPRSWSCPLSSALHTEQQVLFFSTKYFSFSRLEARIGKEILGAVLSLFNLSIYTGAPYSSVLPHIHFLHSV